MVKPCGGPESTRSPKAGTGIKTIACQSPSQADLWGSITLKQTSLQKEKTANIQAKVENTERAYSLLISQEGCPETGFHEIPQILLYKPTLINLPTK